METFVLDWKQKKDIGNNLFRLETKSLDWKHKNQIGIKISTLETIFLDWKHSHFAQIQVQIAGQIDVLYRNLFFVALVILSSWEFNASLVQSERSKRGKVGGP